MEIFAAIVPSADVERSLSGPVESVYEEIDAELKRTSLPTREKRRYSLVSEDTMMPMTEGKSEQGWIREHGAQAPLGQLRTP